MLFARSRHRRLVVVLSVIATAGTVAGFAWMSLRRSAFGEAAGAEACAALYQRARASADTARVDALLPFRGKSDTTPPVSCGSLRERGLVR